VTRPPARPKIYHITHIDNVPSILAADGLSSDSGMHHYAGSHTQIGMQVIKQRRLALPVKCHKGDHVGEYVPFYFCPRSIMLYLFYAANHPELSYFGGQEPIVHLEADLYEAIEWANTNDRRWAFTLSNAGSAYAEFRASVDQFDEVNWTAVAATDFRNPDIKEGKQAEFLMQGFFPWTLVQRIGVHSPQMHSRVLRSVAGASHRPPVEVRPDWYY
jgi:hypothetical protein